MLLQESTPVEVIGNPTHLPGFDVSRSDDHTMHRPGGGMSYLKGQQTPNAGHPDQDVSTVCRIMLALHTVLSLWWPATHRCTACVAPRRLHSDMVLCMGFQSTSAWVFSPYLHVNLMHASLVSCHKAVKAVSGLSWGCPCSGGTPSDLLRPELLRTDRNNHTFMHNSTGCPACIGFIPLCMRHCYNTVGPPPVFSG